ncbi:hypothetical protein FA95DRAFT_1506534, partial [Auriscalpium vulgare]
MTTIAADALSSAVPKLDARGYNWAIWSTRFTVAVEAKEKWGHFDGTNTRPVAAADPVTAEELALQATWDRDERTSKSLLTQRLPDSTVVRLKKLGTVAAQWASLVAEYTVKGAYAQTNLRKVFLESKCPNEGDVAVFMDDLRTRREELAAVGVDIEDADYRSTILASLPTYLSNFASAQLAAVSLINPSTSVDPDTLATLVSHEYERQKLKRRNPGPKSAAPAA